jgi:hypothetical protein
MKWARAANNLRILATRFATQTAVSFRFGSFRVMTARAGWRLEGQHCQGLDRILRNGLKQPHTDLQTAASPLRHVTLTSRFLKHDSTLRNAVLFSLVAIAKRKPCVIPKIPSASPAPIASRLAVARGRRRPPQVGASACRGEG